MARIRSIKPEFWTSAQVLECSTNARLLFIGMWNFCDDAGRHPDSAKQLKAEIFPADDFTQNDILGMIEELDRNDLIFRYVVDGKELIQVTGWEHQRIDKPQKPKYPGPFKDDSGNIPGAFPPDRKGKEGIGEERKGEEGKGGSMSGKPDDSGDQEQDDGGEARTILAHLNEKTGKVFKAVDSNLRLIRARLREGHSPGDMRAVIERKTDEWLGNEKMQQYLRPETLFGATKFNQYVGELSLPDERAESEMRFRTWIGDGEVIAGEVLQ